MEEYDDDVPEPPKLRRGRSKAVSMDPEPEIQPIPARPRSRAKKADPVPEPEELPPAPEPKPKRTRAKPPEPREPEWTEVKPKRARKKPEGPPRDVSFTSARGPISFTANRASAPLGAPSPSRPYRSPYEHLHGPPVNRFSHLMSAW